MFVACCKGSWTEGTIEANSEVPLFVPNSYRQSEEATPCRAAYPGSFKHRRFRLLDHPRVVVSKRKQTVPSSPLLCVITCNQYSALLVVECLRCLAQSDSNRRDRLWSSSAAPRDVEGGVSRVCGQLPYADTSFLKDSQNPPIGFGFGFCVWDSVYLLGLDVHLFQCM